VLTQFFKRTGHVAPAPGECIGVAYSGGADSTALLLAAVSLWPGRVCALHVHHGLQDAADEFLLVCSVLCSSLQVPLYALRVDARHKPGCSPEDAARRVRYRALGQLAQQHGLLAVLLGQHANDQVETLLLALSRGAGLPGLAAMPAVLERGGTRFYRPLLEIAPEPLRDWLQQTRTRFMDDPSNLDMRYTRNRIRANVLPALAATFSHFRETFARSAQHAAQGQRLLAELAAEDSAVVGHPPVIRLLQKLSEARQTNVLRHWLLHAHQTVPTTAQMTQLLSQVAACTTRGHQIDMKVGAGKVSRLGERLDYTGR
jgi:tRNA(Ile)-lysidine synthase